MSAAAGSRGGHRRRRSSSSSDPAGGATDRYRAEAREAAALARKYTPDVTELYSPNATWPAVKRGPRRAPASSSTWATATAGRASTATASTRRSQNGFGLNPEAGGGDSEHQYFGEGKIAHDVDLAKNAVVLLNHLCYASGNTEPGLAEGTLDQAQQRVDNYAAGFIKAGAAAVIAEAYDSPNHMIKAVLGGGRSIESAWRNAPSRNGNAFAFESERSAGYVAQMDPERGTSGFARSIVLKAGLASADVLANARGSAAAAPIIDAESLVPSLAAAGVAAKAPILDERGRRAGDTIRYKYWPYTVDDRKALPKIAHGQRPLGCAGPGRGRSGGGSRRRAGQQRGAEASAEPAAERRAAAAAEPSTSRRPRRSADLERACRAVGQRRPAASPRHPGEPTEAPSPRRPRHRRRRARARPRPRDRRSASATSSSRSRSRSTKNDAVVQGRRRPTRPDAID